MPSANTGLIKLLDAMGGRQAAVDAINAAKDTARDESAAVTLRQLNCWVYAENVPALARFYLLCGAAYLGIDWLRAVTIFPELLPTACLIKSTAELLPDTRAPAKPRKKVAA